MFLYMLKTSVHTACISFCSLQLQYSIIIIKCIYLVLDVHLLYNKSGEEELKDEKP